MGGDPGRVVRMGLLVLLLCTSCALCAPGAAAQPGSGPRETVDQGYTTSRPGSPTGLSFTATYHAAGDVHGKPPAMRRIVIEPPPGMRLDTTVPDPCSASDLELQVRGPAACPAGSLLGGGTLEGLILEPVGHDFVMDHFTHPLYLLNGPDQQIILMKSEGFTVVHSRIRADGSIETDTPAC